MIEAIRELEALGAIQVDRSTSSDSKRRNVNRYQLAIDQKIVVPPKAAGATAGKRSDAIIDPNKVLESSLNKGTTLVPLGNQGSSPGDTISLPEPSINPHSDPERSAHLSTKLRDNQKIFPDSAMREAAEAHGYDPEILEDTIANYRGDLDEAVRIGDAKAIKKYRTLWFGILKDKVPDLADKL